MIYLEASLASALSGIYKCVARKSYREGSAQITVTVAEKPSSCTPVAPENGLVKPDSDVDIGATVTYNCEDDFYINGKGLLRLLFVLAALCVPFQLHFTSIAYTEMITIQNLNIRSILIYFTFKFNL